MDTSNSYNYENLYYLDIKDIPEVEGEDIDYERELTDEEYDYIEKYLRQVSNCGTERIINKKKLLLDVKSSCVLNVEEKEILFTENDMEP